MKHEAIPTPAGVHPQWTAIEAQLGGHETRQYIRRRVLARWKKRRQMQKASRRANKEKIG